MSMHSSSRLSVREEVERRRGPTHLDGQGGSVDGQVLLGFIREAQVLKDVPADHFAQGIPIIGALQ